MILAARPRCLRRRFLHPRLQRRVRCRADRKEEEAVREQAAYEDLLETLREVVRRPAEEGTPASTSACCAGSGPRGC